MWIRIRSDPDHFGLPDPDSGSKRNQSKSWETRIKINKNYQNIIFLKIQITLLRINNKLIQSIINHFLEHNNSHGEKVLHFLVYSRFYFGSGSVFSRGRSRIRINIKLIRIHITGSHSHFLSSAYALCTSTYHAFPYLSKFKACKLARLIC